MQPRNSGNGNIQAQEDQAANMADHDRRDSNGSSVQSEHHHESVEEENKSRSDADSVA